LPANFPGVRAFDPGLDVAALAQRLLIANVVARPVTTAVFPYSRRLNSSVLISSSLTSPACDSSIILALLMKLPSLLSATKSSARMR
jgi:hypothetical protein